MDQSVVLLIVACIACLALGLVLGTTAAHCYCMSHAMTRRRPPIELPDDNWFHDPVLDPLLWSQPLSREAEADRETSAIIPPYEPGDLMTNRVRYEHEKRQGRTADTRSS